MMSPYLERFRTVLCLVPTIAMVAACTSDKPQQSGPTSGAYVAVVQWFVENSPDAQDRPIVFVEARGEGLGVGLETQAAVVSGANDFADVRFIDDRSEAMDSDGVRDNGLFIALGPLVEDGDLFNVECDQVLSEEESTVWFFTLRFRNDTWQLTLPPLENQ